MSYKKFIPCIYLYKGNAVKGFTDNTIIDYDEAFENMHDYGQ